MGNEIRVLGRACSVTALLKVKLARPPSEAFLVFFRLILLDQILR